MKELSPATMEAALRLTERNLTSLIEAKHSDAVLMSDWRSEVRGALNMTTREVELNYISQAYQSKTWERVRLDPCADPTAHEPHEIFYVQFAPIDFCDDGERIQKWSRTPFDGGRMCRVALPDVHTKPTESVNVPTTCTKQDAA